LFDICSKEFVMQNWTKRTLRSALISGGLLMLGTGIASAAENVDPDVPASPLDLHSAQPQASAAMLYAVPAQLLQHEPAPIAEFADDVTEYDLNAPLGSELGAIALPVLPSASPGRSTPIDAPLPVTVPLRGKVSAQPLTPSGTRVTGLRTETAAVPGMTAGTGRTDAPAATLPLPVGLLPTDVASLPMRLPSGGDPQQFAQSTPLTHGGRYNTQAVTSSLTGSAAALLRK
jgi:hypothetical protein